MTTEYPDYVNFGGICRNGVGMQCQYGSRYLCESDIGEGLRYIGSCSDYHSILIHKDDAPIFVERMKKQIDKLMGRY